MIEEWTSLKEKLVKETAWSFAAKGAAMFLYFTLNVFLARRLGVHKFGAWSFYFSILSIVFLLSCLGINSSAQKHAAQFNRTDELRSVLVASLKLRTAFSGLFALLFLSLAGPLAGLLHRPEFTSLFRASVVLVFLYGTTEFFKSVFQGLHRLKYSFLITVSEHGFKLLLVPALLFLAPGPGSIVKAFTLALAAASAVGLYLFQAWAGTGPSSAGPGRVREILRYSAPLFIAGIGYTVMTEVDTLMLGYLSSDYEVGIYAAAKQVMAKLPHIAYAVALGTMPVFAGSRDPAELRRLLGRLLRLNSAVYGIICLAIVLSGRYLVPLVFGSAYTASIRPLFLLLPYLLMLSYAHFLGPVLDYRDRAAGRALNMAMAIGLNILFNLLFIPPYGAAGAAAATSLSFLPYLLLNWLQVRRALGPRAVQTSSGLSRNFPSLEE